MLKPIVLVSSISEIATHKVHIYTEYHSVCPLVGIGTLPPPLSSLGTKGWGGGGHTRLRVRGWGSPNSDDWRKSLALCLLCARESLKQPLIYLGVFLRLCIWNIKIWFERCRYSVPFEKYLQSDCLPLYPSLDVQVYFNRFKILHFEAMTRLCCF